jgi:hypothetical protein
MLREDYDMPLVDCRHNILVYVFVSAADAVRVIASVLESIAKGYVL